QLALLQQFQAAGGDDLIAVDLLPGLVHHEAAVGVPVEGHAQIVVARLHHGLEALQVGGAAAAVDVHPVGVGVDDVGVEVVKPVKEPTGGGGGSAVGAVHQNLQPGQVGGDGGHQVVNVVLALLGVGV